MGKGPGGDLDDASVVEAQLGRRPRGAISVVARCGFGLPLVIRTPRALEDGSPFPTLYYLTCPLAVRHAGALESAGVMKELNERLASDPALAAAYRDAHDRYVTDRDGVDRDGTAGPADSAGGMPLRVKCLHALYAHEIAAGNPIGALVRDRIDPVGCPGRCVSDDGGGATRVAGHPGYARSRRR